MNSLFLILLIVQGCVFLVWGVLAFSWLFALRADAIALSGRTFPNMSSQLKAFQAGLVAPRYHNQRVRLLLATAILIALSATAFIFAD